MSEEIAEAAGLIEEIARLRADNAELRASAELIHRQWRSMVAERAGLRTQLALANAENATLRDAHTAALAWLDVCGGRESATDDRLYPLKVGRTEGVE